MTIRDYETLRAEVRSLQDQGRIPKKLDRTDAIDWVYGNTAIENPNITREMVERAYDAKLDASK